MGLISSCYIFAAVKLMEGTGEFAGFSTKQRWDRRNKENLIDSVLPCHDSQAVGLYMASIFQRSFRI